MTLKALAFPLLATLALGATACSRGDKNLDEFAVARNAPLVIPPDYSLTPPAAGTLSTTAEGSQQQAVEALFGGPAPRSTSETSMLEEAGRDRAQLGIRSMAGDPATRVVDKGALTTNILLSENKTSEVASAQ